MNNYLKGINPDFNLGKIDLGLHETGRQLYTSTRQPYNPPSAKNDNTSNLDAAQWLFIGVLLTFGAATAYLAWRARKADRNRISQQTIHECTRRKEFEDPDSYAHSRHENKKPRS